MNSRFHGAIPAMVTPFDSDYRLHEDRVRDLIEGYVAAGVHGIPVAGSQGAFFLPSNRGRPPPAGATRS